MFWYAKADQKILVFKMNDPSGQIPFQTHHQRQQNKLYRRYSIIFTAELERLFGHWVL